MGIKRRPEIAVSNVGLSDSKLEQLGRTGQLTNLKRHCVSMTQLEAVQQVTHLPDTVLRDFSEELTIICNTAVFNYYLHKVAAGRRKPKKKKVSSEALRYKKLRAAANRFLSELAKLNDQESLALAKEVLHAPPRKPIFDAIRAGVSAPEGFEEYDDEYLEAIKEAGLGELTLSTGQLIEAIDAVDKCRPKRRGRPPTHPRLGDQDFPLAMFITSLVCLTNRCGGRIAGDGEGEGTLVQVLKVLLPSVPSNLLPAVITQGDACDSSKGLNELRRLGKLGRKLFEYKRPSLAKILQSSDSVH